MEMETDVDYLRLFVLEVSQCVVADLRPLDLGVSGGRGWANSVSRQWAPISAQLTHMVKV